MLLSLSTTANYLQLMYTNLNCALLQTAWDVLPNLWQELSELGLMLGVAWSATAVSKENPHLS